MTKMTFSDGAYLYQRITKAEARKRFNANLTFQICFVKMRPGGPWFLDMLVDPSHIKSERMLTPTYPTPESLFDATVTEFCYYNANCNETGTYAAFYIRTERKPTANVCSK